MYRWTDGDGIEHFADDLATVPPVHRPKKPAGNELREASYDGGLSGVRVSRIQILGQGIFKVKKAGRYGARTMSGEVSTGSFLEIQERTTTIPAKLGIAFGISYSVLGGPPDGRADLVIRVLSPPLHNPVTGETSSEQSWASSKRMNQPTEDLYIFEEPWELVTGKWTIQVMYKDMLLGQRSFSVVRAK